MDANVMIWKWPSWGKLIRLLTEENHAWMKLAQKVVLQLIINLSNWMRGNLPNNIHNPIPGFFFTFPFSFLWKAPRLYQDNIIAHFFSYGHHFFTKLILLHDYTCQTALYSYTLLSCDPKPQSKRHVRSLQKTSCFPTLSTKLLYIMKGSPYGWK